MAELNELGNVIETDVLVIGAGISGLFASISAGDFTKKVTLVDKGPIGYTSQCYWALGGHQLFLPEHNIDDWVKEVGYFEDWLCEQDLIEMIYKRTHDRIKDFERLGVKFFKTKVKTKDGKYSPLTTRGLDHIRKAIPDARLSGGRWEVEVTAKEANRRGVQLLSHIFIFSLLKQGDRVVGAVGFHRKTGEFYIFKAGAVVITTGQCSFKGHYAAQFFLTGDGMAMALDAGAELRNLEFVTLWLQGATFVWEGLGQAFPMGATLLNGKNEPFMDKYSPVLKSNIDYNYQARAMALEARAGRGPFYVDYTTISSADREYLEKISGWMELHVNKLKETGISPYEEKWEVVPVFWTVQGIKTGTDCQTATPGLFVGGRVRSVDPGVTMGSWSIASATVLGHMAGESAAKYAKLRERPRIDQSRVKSLKEEIFAGLGKAGIEPEKVLVEIQKTVFNYDVIILKNETNLKKALAKIEDIRDELLPKMGARDIHYLVNSIEVKNMTLIAEAMLRASLMRTESRASHYREDYPTRDDNKWMKWIIVSRNNGKLGLRTEPVPLAQYRFKPTRYYSDNFRVPEPGK